MLRVEQHRRRQRLRERVGQRGAERLALHVAVLEPIEARRFDEAEGYMVQSLVHMTSNNTSHRGGAFVVSMLALLALWINVGMAICARL